MIKGEKWIRQTRNRPGDREERRKNLSVYMPIRSCLWYNVCKTDIIPSRIWFLRSPQKTRRPIPPEGYHGASGFRVHRENPGAQISRRGTMSGGHGIMSAKQTLYHGASGFRVHRENPGAQISRRGTMSEGHGIMKILCKWKRVLPWTDIADGFGLF